jgi:hypothetical protein
MSSNACGFTCLTIGFSLQICRAYPSRTGQLHEILVDPGAHPCRSPRRGAPSMLTPWVRQARHIIALNSVSMTTCPFIHIDQGVVVHDIRKDR